MASIDASPGRVMFGAGAELYDFARPGYPPDLFDWLRGTASLDAASDCFEIGAGTGQATFPVLAYPVRSLLAIEPDHALADRLIASGAGDARLRVAIEPFETCRLPLAAFDFGFAATSLHWLRRMKAFDLVLAALRPGGSFAAWWNVYHDPSSPDAFARATAHVFSGIEEAPSRTAVRPPFALDINARMGEMRAAGFVDVRHALFRWTEAFTPARLAGLYATFSRVRMAPAETRAHLLENLETVAEALARESGGEIRRDIVTSVFCGHRP
ncbi:MAG: class I SAM-dependent methyltransferase [Alphaproteobacteria bacterium]|nr:class I SAM-dependent methyltransferase [Alphaproteobacteria bacterium]